MGKQYSNTATLGSLGMVITGKTPNTKVEEYWNGAIPFITPSELNGALIRSSERSISRKGLLVVNEIPRGAVLTTCIGSTIGRAGISSFGQAATNQQINAIIVDPKIADNWFCLYAILYSRESLVKAAQKTAVPILSKSNFCDVEIPFPELSIQRKIGRILFKVQSAIEQQEQLIALTTELKKALMHKLFTEGTRGEPQKETEIGLVPESWEVVELGKACAVQTGIAKGRKIDPDIAITLPYLRVANVQDGFLDLSEMKDIVLKKSEVERYLLKEGDVVLTEGDDLDKLGRGFIWHGQIEQCVHQNHIFAVRPDGSRLLSEFLAYQVQSPYGKAYFLNVAHKTTNLACINTSKLKGFPLLIPSMEQQHEIADALALIDRKREVITQKLEALRNLFQTLLNQLMTAQIRVNDIDLAELGLETEAQA